jgi:hypothetical protein
MAEGVDQLLEHLRKNDGRLVFSWRSAKGEGQRALVGYEFGAETVGNSVVGGAAYGIGPDFDEALTSVLDQVGIPDEPSKPA